MERATMSDQRRASTAALKAYVGARTRYYEASNAAHRAEDEAALKRAYAAKVAAAYEAAPDAALRVELAIASSAAHRAERDAAVKRAAAFTAGAAFEAAISEAGS
jgi:hypothetical protein